VHETNDHELTLVQGSIVWLDDGLLAEFYYHGQTMQTETAGDGVNTLIAKFEADTRP
jgi:hypothetical protein